MLEITSFIAVLLLSVIVVLLSMLLRAASKAIRAIQRIAEADTRFRQWNYLIEGTVTGGSTKSFEESLASAGAAGYEAVAVWTETEIADPTREAKNYVFVLFKHLSGT